MASTSPDPVLAVVERHRPLLAADLEVAGDHEAAYTALEWQRQDLLPLPPIGPSAHRLAYEAAQAARVTPLWEERQRLFNAEEALAVEILTTRATSVAGIVAKIEVALSRTDEWHGHQGADEIEPVALSVRADLERLTG